MKTRLESPVPLTPEAQREQLLARSAALRSHITADLRRLQPAFDWADKLRAGTRAATEHRALALAGVAVLAAALLRRPRRLLALGVRAAAAIQVARQLQPLARSVRRWLAGGKRA